MYDPLHVPAEVLTALTGLNVHARANGFGKKAIYVYKTFVACAAATEATPVQIGAKCHHCGGTGIYRDWDGYERGTCYRCKPGIVTLQFVESQVGGARWHHPVYPFSNGALDVLRCAWGIREMRYPHGGGEIAVLSDGTERAVTWGSPGDWGPNMPGAEKLPTDEAAGLLNVVEEWLLGVYAPPLRRGADWPYRRAMETMTKYQIDLDRVDEGACWRCGTEENLCTGRVSRWTGYTRYARKICEGCYAGPKDLVWPTDPHPASLTPNVLAWLAHPARRLPFEPPRELQDW